MRHGVFRVDAMFAQRLAVVTGNHDGGLFANAGRLQPLQERREVVFHLSNRSVVAVDQVMDGPRATFERDEPVSTPISNVDVLPALFDEFDLAAPDCVEGVRFSEYLAGATDECPRDAAFTQYTNAGNEARGIVTEEYTLIRNFSVGRTIDFPRRGRSDESHPVARARI